MNCNICGMPDFSGHVCDEKRIEKILLQLGRNTGKSLLCAEKAAWVIKEYTKKRIQQQLQPEAVVHGNSVFGGLPGGIK